jgi:hypothetical protein
VFPCYSIGGVVGGKRDKTSQPHKIPKSPKRKGGETEKQQRRRRKERKEREKETERERHGGRRTL